jgi:cyclic pyranopterin monophosphate synthase
MQLVGGDVVGKKGPIFTTAVIAGVQAAKRTSSLIPFCHPLPLEDCKIDIALLEDDSLVQVSFTC